MIDDKIKTLPVQHREAVKDRVLEVVRATGPCRHTHFLVDERLKEITCADCSAKLDPMFALIQIANEETQYHLLQSRYQDEMTRLSKRQKTKCSHCGQMTWISHR